MEPAPIIVDKEEEYEVKEIQDSHIHCQKLQYLVKWKVYSDKDSSWEPVKNVTHCKTHCQVPQKAL